MAKKTIATEAEIVTLSDAEHVRQRRGMYLPNMNYCVYEIVDNAVDEFMAGNCKNIWVQLEPDKVLRIQDDGSGVPIKPDKKDPSKSMAEVALGELKSGGKFNAEGSMGNQGVKTGGLNGTGSSAVNFTCDQFIATITKEGKMYQIGWEKGQLVQPLTSIGQADEDDIQHGTLIELLPDMTIWEDSDFDVNAIARRLEQLTYLNPGLTIHEDIGYAGKQIEGSICNPEGLKAYLEKLSENKTMIVEPITFSGHLHLKSNKIYSSKEVVKQIFEDENNNEITDLNDIVDVDIALCYNTTYQNEIYVFTNNVPNDLGGHHLVGFKEGLFKSINNYYEENTKGKLVTLVQDDVREGLIAVVSIKIANPVFDGQGKAKLDMPKVRASIRTATMEMVDDFLDKNPDAAKIIIAKAIQAQTTREAVRKTREAARGAKKLFGGDPDKLTDCTSKNPEERELWLAEGDSAGGSCKKARNSETQAILPVFGKILNAEGLKLSDILKSTKLEDIIKALGCGIGKDFDIEKLKYHKIIIAADADDDGLHIQTLWITFFYRFMPEIIENGYLYISCPPLFKVYKNKDNFQYCYTIAEKDEAVKQYDGKCVVTRYKGLGEMEEEDLAASTMCPTSRVLIQVCMDDMEYDEQIISTCMGDNVALRKEMILDDDIGELI